MGKKIEPIISAMGVFTSLIEGLVKAVNESGGSMEGIYRLATPEGAETLKKIAKIILNGFNEVRSPFLKLISSDANLVIEALDGKTTIVKAEKMFKWIDPNFHNWGLDKPGLATEQMQPEVHEMTADATFAQMFNFLPGGKEKQVVSQSQLIKFCKKYRRWLHQGGYTTFF